MNHYKLEVIHQGDESGNDMTVKYRLPSGLEIFGLPTMNFYGGHWDLGPTWNYAVMADKPFLVDSGRFGQGQKLVGMMDSVGIDPEDLEFVLISHSHEDHDGGLAELVKSTRLKVKAHAIYDLLIRKYPRKAPAGYKEDFPAKCWHCFMPESFYTRNCRDYHKVFQELEVDRLGDGKYSLGANIHTYHLPGHSPDCLAVLLGDEAIIVGDIVLPDITPWPTREAMYDEVADIIRADYTRPQAIFGLQRYIKSLKKLAEIARLHPDVLVLPAHRLYYNGRWNPIYLEDKVNELRQHHIQRCAAILDILSDGPMIADDIARHHFDPGLLEGLGSLMAANEVISHCELLIHSGDVVALEENKYAATGSTNFEADIHALRSDF
ncbi:MAG: MBL fold metallo-hydrolase [Desulfobacterales bacterium]|nr:MAG: MBL fold metallo-hydrolase [Desulfobacterales bacterium]